tara:strand:- start:2336 stop:2509 length:174 start_codon:yes stop_codon:yes gene_type:complete
MEKLFSISMCVLYQKQKLLSKFYFRFVRNMVKVNRKDLIPKRKRNKNFFQKSFSCGF